jgi:DNA-binding MarR family transcriptional regulator
MFDHCLYFNSTALARRIEREWADAFAPFDLTPAQGFLMRAVLAKPGLTPGALASLLVVSRPTATRAIQALVARGLIIKQGREGDGREQSLLPTDQAKAMAEALNAAGSAMTRHHKDKLGDATFDEVVGLMRTLRNALD